MQNTSADSVVGYVRYPDSLLEGETVATTTETHGNVCACAFLLFFYNFAFPQAVNSFIHRGKMRIL